MLKDIMRKRFYDALYPEDEEYEHINPNMSDVEVKTLLDIFDESRIYVDGLIADGRADETECCKVYHRLCGILMWLDSTTSLWPVEVDALGDLALDICLPDEVVQKMVDEAIQKSEGVNG